MEIRNKKILEEQEIEQIFLDLVNEYGRRLPEKQKVIARRLLNELHNGGKSWEWIYWALWQLGDRTIAANKGLLFYGDYQREVDEIMKYARQYYFDDIETYDSFAHSIGLWMYFPNELLEGETIERLEELDNRAWNCADEDFTKEEEKELKDMYIRRCKKQILVPRSEWEQEQRAIIAEVRRVCGKVVSHPPHPYCDWDLYYTPPRLTEEKRQRGIELGFYKE